MTKPAAKSQANLDLALALLEQAAKLLASTTAKQPSPAERSASPTIERPPPTSPRVAKLLRELGVGVAPDDLHMSRNSSTPRGARAVVPRRAVVALLATEDASVAEIARETGLAESTVRAHMPR